MNFVVSTTMKAVSPMLPKWKRETECPVVAV